MVRLSLFPAVAFAALFVGSFIGEVHTAAAAEAYDLGDRRELFVDARQIESLGGSATLKLHAPQPAEIALKFDSPWDGPLSAYVTVFRDGDKVRMYYRGWKPDGPGKEGEKTGQEFACYAESTDGGKTFVKPKLGLFEVGGSKDNNIVWPHPSHNFVPFKDERPGVPEAERYKAIKDGRNAQRKRGLYSFDSPDGIHWRKRSEDPFFSDGAFDSQNLAYWDPVAQEYRCYFRIFTKGVTDENVFKPAGIRAVALTRSKDFVTWSAAEPIVFTGDAPQEQFYTNATTNYFRAPQYYFMFPKRFVKDRVGLVDHKGISDAMFLSSRDGVRFDRTFLEAFIRPGRDELNWGDRSTMPAWGLIQTGPDEMSVYYSQHYRKETAHVRRGVLRLDGIASLHADGKPGELVTKPFTFRGKKLTLNYATSAAGNVQVEIQNADGSPIPGFTLADAPEAFGDKIDATFAWKNGDDVSALAGKPVRLRFVLRDADVYAYRFSE
jgi:hypothetical protein